MSHSMSSTPSRHAWIEPGAHMVAEGVHRIPLPLPTDGLRAVNVYAIEQGDGLVLVDAGWALDVSERALVDALGEIGYGLGDIVRFLVTHAHRDHYTQAMTIRRRFGTRVALGLHEQESIRAVARRAENPHAAGPFVQVGLLRRAGDLPAAAALEGLRAEGIVAEEWRDPDDWLSHGDRLALGQRELTVLATPGHTRGHVVFADDAHGLLFAGDHILPHITPSIGYEEVVSRSPLGDYLDSLALMRSHPDALLLPAHGPAGMSVHDRVEQLLTHHQQRLDESLRAVAAGASTAVEVADRLTWTRRQTSLRDLDRFNRMMAVLETLAHLVVLVETGRLRSAWDEVDGVGVERFSLP